MSLYKMWVTMTVAFLFLSCSILKFLHNKKKRWFEFERNVKVHLSGSIITSSISSVQNGTTGYASYFCSCPCDKERNLSEMFANMILWLADYFLP